MSASDLIYPLVQSLVLVEVTSGVVAITVMVARTVVRGYGD